LTNKNKKKLAKKGDICLAHFLRRKVFESPELQKLTAAAYPPPAKVKSAPGAKGGDAGAKAASADSDEITPSRLDIRCADVKV
jgi:tyrosyl-tRNA synthetase